MAQDHVIAKKESISRRLKYQGKGSYYGSDKKADKKFTNKLNIKLNVSYGFLKVQWFHPDHKQCSDFPPRFKILVAVQWFSRTSENITNFLFLLHNTYNIRNNIQATNIDL